MLESSWRCFLSVVLFLSLLLSLSPLATIQETAQSGPKPARVVVTATALEVEVGQQLQFSALGYDDKDSKIEGKPSAWFASPFDLAYSDENGNVTFTAPGEVKVGAIINGKSGS